MEQKLEIEGCAFILKKDNTQRRARYYCAMQNPFIDRYDVKLIKGSSLEVLERKIISQFEKFKKESRGKQNE